MGKLTRQELIDLVQSRFDEVSPSDQVAVIPTAMIELELDMAVEQVVRTAKKVLVYPAGRPLVKDTKFYLVRLDKDGNPVSLIIPLRNGFLRFIRLKLANWTCSVDALVDVDSPEYIRQSNKYQAATVGRPVAALIPFSWTVDVENTPINYDQAIECFPPMTKAEYALLPKASENKDGYVSAEAAAQLIDANLHAVMNIELDTRMVTDYVAIDGYYEGENNSLLPMAAEDLPDTLTDALLWLVAGRCLTSLKDNANAQSCYANYQSCLAGSKLSIASEKEGA